MAAGFGDCRYLVVFPYTRERNIRMALSPFVRFFLQLGQIRETVPSDAFSSVK